MSILDAKHQHTPVATAPCLPRERVEASKHQGKRVVVGGELAIIAPSISISGDASDCIRVRFPPDADQFPAAPDEIQKIVDRLKFTLVS
jgi:hypothetical protein